jgi:hypothetical protein
MCLNVNNHALQHIGVYVDNVAAALEEFRAKGARMLDEKTSINTGRS